jgi:hypothetical protein
MKANQVVPETEKTKPHWMKKASLCHYCGSDIKQTYGILVGNKTFCDYTCLANYHAESYHEPVNMRVLP